MICPYCQKEAPWVENKAIYGRNYGKSFMCYYCKPCDAYVGCHQNSKTPLGTMANKELRAWRIRAHDHIDPLWKTGRMKRKEVYAFLKEKLGVQVHVAESDLEMCKRILAVEFDAADEEDREWMGDDYTYGRAPDSEDC